MFPIRSFAGQWCFLIQRSSSYRIASDVMILNHIIRTIMIGCDELMERRSPAASMCHGLAAAGESNWQFATSFLAEDV